MHNRQQSHAIVCTDKCMAGKTEYAVKTPQSACALPANRRLTPELAEDAVAHLERFGRGAGARTLLGLSAERPVAYVRAMVRLVAVLHRCLPGKTSDATGNARACARVMGSCW